MYDIVALISTAVVVGGAIILALRFRPHCGIHLLSFWLAFPGVPILSFAIYGHDKWQIGSLALTALPLFLVYVTALTISSGPSRTAERLMRNLDDLFPYRSDLAILFLICFTTEIFIRLTYSILVSGSSDREFLLLLPPWVAPATFLLRIVSFAGFVYWAMHMKGNKWLILPCSAFLLLQLVINGRMAMLFALLVAITLVIRNLSISFRPKWVLLGSMALGLFAVLSPIFVLARGFYRELAPFYDVIPAVSLAFTQAIETATTTSNYFDKLHTNLEQRGNTGLFFLDFLGSCPGHLWGQITSLALQWTVPSALADKPDTDVEQFVQAYCGLPLTDEATSLIGYWWLDFGVGGVVMAGVAIGTLLRTLLHWAGDPRLSVPSRLILLSVFYTVSLTQETEIQGYMVLLRDAIATIILFEVLRFLRLDRRTTLARTP